MYCSNYYEILSGRTLGLEESILLNLEHAHKGAGVRECAYQTLLEWKGMLGVNLLYFILAFCCK